MAEAPAKPESTEQNESTEQAQPDTKRVNVIFSNDQYQVLQKLANMQKISLSDALRQAISVADLVVNANEDKDTRILLDKGGKIQELKIVR